ncbi:heterogeneous nuclear ribonucleoprotein U-like protein 2 [Anoplophora glabripennis]|uniref:heterogeneous nuclear ribonucleoprotein U-like protein 2 n=1 Tax=Anoplophora glabripennis TaxID=217634 RepID=UPI000873A392|nr:heterogeneous nuclear ribonucleoprotein U-like protein 2 [Anoplophora glabripennis]
MSSTIDPAKLKVVDLRSELSARGLDTKGNKAALVKRLKDALEQELKQDIPDTSIADTSTEDLDTSQCEERSQESPEKESTIASASETIELGKPKSETASERLSETNDSNLESSSKSAAPEIKVDHIEEPTFKIEAITPKEVNQMKMEENGEHSEQKENTKFVLSDEISEKAENQESSESKEQDAPKSDDLEQKGEKRRRTSNSPERSQRRRSRSPIKEDEPLLDNNKVQLSWYDSDLHLQLDKESFLSAKPLTEGAFGYAWAGVRATHGVSSGKVCYEVKLTEQIKWEDFSKYYEQRGGRDRYRTDHRKNQKRDKDKKDVEKKSEEKLKSENGQVKDEKSTEKEEKCLETDEKSTEKNEPTEEKENLSDKEDQTENIAEKVEDASTETVEKSKDVEHKTEKTDDKEMEVDTPEENKDLKEEQMDTTESKTETQPEPLPTHLFRVGWSLVTSSLQLGEEKFSYGYESTGKFVTDKQFTDYGITFEAGDVIGSFLNIDAENVTITYTVNGQIQPIATTIPKTDFPDEDFSLFPHVLSRNYAFEFNLGEREEPWFAIPSELEGYIFLSKIEDKVSGPVRPESRGECEVILMCGLPASGKSHWVKEHVTSNLDKKFTVLGNSNLLEKMTVSGEPLKRKFKGRWSSLMDKLQKSLNKLITIAALRRRNYIIDQTNVFPSAQRRKMRPFEGFKRRAVIVVVGDEEQARRQSLQEAQDGKDVPDSTILEMKAAMSLPEKGDWLEEVTYVELEESEAKEIVKKYNAAGKEAGYGSEKRFGRRDDRWQNRRNDFRGKNFRERSYHNQRYDSRGPRQGGWNNQRSGGNNWNRDRRNNRGPPSREWRGSGHDHGSRDVHSQGGNYNRHRPQGGNRGHGNWSGGNWSGQGWNQQAFGTGSGGYGGNQNWNNQWKYGGGSGGSGSGQQGYGSGYGNWNYYGQYGQQNWNSQK